MENKNSHPKTEEKQRVRALTRGALYCALIGLALPVIMRVASFINGDFILDAVKGPNPVAGYIAQSSFTIAFYVNGIAFVLGFVSLILAPFRRPIFGNLIVSLCALLVAFIAYATCVATIEQVRDAPGRFHARAVNHLGRAIKNYSEKHGGRLPPAANWCDVLAGFDANTSYYFAYPIFNAPNDSSIYALNENLADVCYGDIPSDAVLLFETKPARNPVGGRESITTDNHNGEGCIVLFGDLHVEFVKEKNFNGLRWKP